MWLPALAQAVTPPDTVGGDLVTYLLSYGVLGVLAVAFAFRFIVPAKALDKERENARADLVEENKQLLARAEKAEQQRDDLLRIEREQLMPLLSSFTQTAQSLIPLLQDQLRYREEGRDRGPR